MHHRNESSHRPGIHWTTAVPLDRIRKTGCGRKRCSRTHSSRSAKICREVHRSPVSILAPIPKYWLSSGGRDIGRYGKGNGAAPAGSGIRPGLGHSLWWSPSAQLLEGLGTRNAVTPDNAAAQKRAEPRGGKVWLRKVNFGYPVPVGTASDVDL